MEELQQADPAPACVGLLFEEIAGVEVVEKPCERVSTAAEVDGLEWLDSG